MRDLKDSPQRRRARRESAEDFKLRTKWSPPRKRIHHYPPPKKGRAVYYEYHQLPPAPPPPKLPPPPKPPKPPPPRLSDESTRMITKMIRIITQQAPNDPSVPPLRGPVLFRSPR